MSNANSFPRATDIRAGKFGEMISNGCRSCQATSILSQLLLFSRTGRSSSGALFECPLRVSSSVCWCERATAGAADFKMQLHREGPHNLPDRGLECPDIVGVVEHGLGCSPGLRLGLGLATTSHVTNVWFVPPYHLTVMRAGQENPSLQTFPPTLTPPLRPVVHYTEHTERINKQSSTMPRCSPKRQRENNTKYYNVRMSRVQRDSPSKHQITDTITTHSQPSQAAFQKHTLTTKFLVAQMSYKHAPKRDTAKHNKSTR